MKFITVDLFIVILLIAPNILSQTSNVFEKFNKQFIYNISESENKEENYSSSKSIKLLVLSNIIEKDNKLNFSLLPPDSQPSDFNI